MEHLINIYASKSARGSIADFMGYVDVNPDEAAARLTAGRWLMWRYEGSNTLAYYMRRRDALRALGRDLRLGDDAAPELVVAIAMRQILQVRQRIGCTAVRAACCVQSHLELPMWAAACGTVMLHHGMLGCRYHPQRKRTTVSAVCCKHCPSHRKSRT